MKPKVLFCAFALAAAAASAQAQRANGPVSFDALDADDDGKVTLEEFKSNFTPPQGSGRTPNHERLFGRWDADGDGELTAEEFANRPRRGQRN
ncbi:MAG: EF-hand domain-containing protein [Pseudomonadota bacterium]